MSIYSKTVKNNSVVEESSVDGFEQAMENISEASYDPDFGGIMKTVIQIYECDHDMFNALIEGDFISVTNEAVMLEEEAAKANEAANKIMNSKILEKIGQIVEAVKAAIVKLFTNFIVKLTELFNNDKKLFDKYSKYLKMENLEGFPGIDDFSISYSNKDVRKRHKNLESGLDNTDKAVDAIKRIYSANSKDEIDEICDGITLIGDVVEGPDGETKQKKWYPDKDAIVNMIVFIKSGKEIIGEAKSFKEECFKILDKIKKESNELRKIKDGDELITYKAAKSYKISSDVSKLISEQFAKEISLWRKFLAQNRKAFIICGRYAYKKYNKTDETEADDNFAESCIVFALGESSDTYVSELFGTI